MGQDDLPARAARRLLRPGMTPRRFHPRRGPGPTAPSTDGADYVAVGSMFPTGSKAAFRLVGPALLRRVRPLIPVPLVAIGWITEANVGEVIRAGAGRGGGHLGGVRGRRTPRPQPRDFLGPSPALAPVGRTADPGQNRYNALAINLTRCCLGGLKR